MKKDRAVVLAFHRALYVEHAATVMDPELAPFYAYKDLEAAMREDVEALLGSPQAAVLIAELDGEAVGYVTGHFEEDERRVLPRKGVVQDWYVKEEARGLGVGKMLLELLEESFAEAGCGVIESTTFPFNAGARKAHERLGFREVQIRYRKRIGPAAKPEPEPD
jgi:ribosomal protein S18 acetylase RimI-like enzyme